MTNTNQPAGGVLWAHNAPVLDQGKIGSCTGNAVTQFLNTDYAMGISGRKSYLTEDDAVQIYTIATQIDDYPGAYPQSDTGSDGNAACEAAIKLGYLSQYRTVGNDLIGVLAVLRTQPVIVGCNWLSGMFQPDANGVVDATGDMSGGHEFLLLGFDPGKELICALNSWSASWGVNGRFFIRFKDLPTLMADKYSFADSPIVKAA